MWQEDVKIDVSELERENLKVPLLHGKYLKFYSNERLKLKALKQKKAQLTNTLFDYYRGDLNNPEDLKLINREKYNFTKDSKGIERCVEGDSEMININIKFAYQSELVDVLEEIVKSLNNRGFVIKNAIEVYKINNGLK